MIRMINISVLFHFSIGSVWDSFLWFSFILICQVLPALVCWKLSSTDLQETATLFSDLIKIHLLRRHINQLSFFWLNTKVRELIIIDPRRMLSIFTVDTNWVCAVAPLSFLLSPIPDFKICNANTHCTVEPKFFGDSVE